MVTRTLSFGTNRLVDLTRNSGVVDGWSKLAPLLSTEVRSSIPVYRCTGVLLRQRYSLLGMSPLGCGLSVFTVGTNL